MSYDYNAILQSIATNRKKAYQECSASPSYPSSTAGIISKIDIEPLSQAVEDFATLSSHCPLPPMLWLQYACDAGALMENLLASEDESDAEEKRNNNTQVSETRIGILGAGIEEFPGSKLLRRWYLDEKVRNYFNGSLMDLDKEMEIWKAFQDAIEWVCEGSYFCESDDSNDIQSIWNMAVSFLRRSKSFSNEHVKECYIHRSAVPMLNINDALRDEISDIPEIANDAAFLEKIENGRRESCKRNQHMGPWEATISEAMDQEGISISKTTKNEVRIYDGNIFLRYDSSSKNTDSAKITGHYLMGLGGEVTADAFIQCVKSISVMSNNPKHIRSYQDSEAKTQKEIQLSIRIYERAISECPTVEKLWITYIHFLLRISQSHSNFFAPSALLDASHRSVRNCPYSVSLFKLQMHCHTLNINDEIDVDGLLEIVKTATEGKFLPTVESYLDLHMEVPRVIRRRLLKVLSSSLHGDNENVAIPFDVSDKDLSQSYHYNEKLSSLSIEDKTELIHDLIDDIREAYDAADLFVRKNHHNWNNGRAILWRERAATEAHIIFPILLQLSPDSIPQNRDNITSERKRRKKKSDEEKAIEGKMEEEAIKSFEKLVRIHPKCVDAWREYIAFMMRVDVSASVYESAEVDYKNIVEKFRKVRGLYHRAIKVAGAVIQSENNSLLDQIQHVTPKFSNALQGSSGVALCQDFLAFENNFGSQESINNAVSLVRIKLKKLESVCKPSSLERGQCDERKKRALDETIAELGRDHQSESERENEKKRKKVNDISVQDIDGVSNETAIIPKKTNLKIEKPVTHFVVVGKLKYPAHPFTVHISNLSPETKDMDLVDQFKQCGAIVHARILREKNHNLKQKLQSKGSALIQFEEKSSVDHALKLSENIGIHERLVKVQRSHCAAVTIVPSGMHRINPKGQGKRSKVNEVNKKKNLKLKMKYEETTMETDQNVRDQNNSKKKQEESSNDQFKIRGDIAKSKDLKLAFHPRGLTNRNLKKKKINLSMGKN